MAKRKRGFKKGRKGGNSKMRKIATSVAKKIVHRNIENKVIEQSFNGTMPNTWTSLAVTTAGSAGLLNGTSQGAATTARVGGKIKQVALMLRYSLRNSTLVQPVWVRIAVVWDRQPNGAAPDMSTLWDSNTAGSDYLANRNVNGVDRYSVLHDKTYPMTVHGGASNQAAVKFFKKRFRLGFRQTVYNSTGGLIADIQSGSLYIMGTCDTNASTDYRVRSKVTFEDA